MPRTPETFTHNADGNLTADARWTYTWDGENRLIALETTAQAVAVGVARQKLEFAYDSQSRRTSKKVSNWNGTTWVLASHTLFLYDAWNMLAEFTIGSPSSVLSLVRSYVWGLDLSGSIQGAGGVGGLVAITDHSTLSPQPTTHFACYDGNGNLTGSVNAADGKLSAKYDYTAFGETLLCDGPFAAANPFRFSTKFTDNETGHIYYGYRSYAPEHGRWPSRDPIEEQGGVNLYGYAGNDPVNRVDPLGLWSPLAHDYLLDYAFRIRSDVSREKIGIMQASSRAFDIATAVGVSFANMHSMRNDWQTSDEAKDRRDAFIMRRINRARELRKACREKEAHELLGQAFHAVMDSTSPEHADDWGNLKVYRGTRDLYGHSAGKDYLIGRLPFLRGNEDARDLTPAIYYRNAVMLHYYYNLYLRD